MAAHNRNTAAPGRLKGWLAAAGLLTVAAACGPAGLLSRAAAGTRQSDLPKRVRLAVPFVRQKGEWCGPAALAMVLNFHGRHVSQDEIAAHMGKVKGGGVLNLDLKLYARSLGFRAESRAGAIDDLESEVAAERPVICIIRLKQGLHYLPVVGYDQTKKRIIVHLRRPFVSIPCDAFERMWRGTEFWMLTIAPPDEKGDGDDAKGPAA